MTSTYYSYASGSSARRMSNSFTPQHILEWGRNNQRRHPARRRDYNATLEQKLSRAEPSVTAQRDPGRCS